MAVNFNQIIGSTSNDQLSTLSGRQDVVLALQGDDIITGDFQTADYIIGGNGDDLLVSNFSYTSFSIQSHPLPSMNGSYLVRYTADNGQSIVNVVKDIETFQFLEGTVSLQGFLSGAAPEPLNNDVVTVNLDGLGAIDAPATLDASADDFLYKDDLSLSDYVVINNFGQGDKIEILAKQGDVLSIANEGENVIITNNSTTDASGNIVISSITLIGIVSCDDIISDEASLNLAMGFDALAITII